MMSLRTDCDPELHTLRSVVRAIPDARVRQDAEGARFNLYAALEHADAVAAGRWCTAALETALVLALVDDLARVRATAAAAVRAIRACLDEA
jgi:hypothetical protein